MKMNPWIILAIGFGLVLILKLVMRPGGAEKAAAREKIKQGALVIDVRTRDEFARGHFAGATNIPVRELASRQSELGKEKARSIVVYCAAGTRAAQAKAILEKAGFADVTNAGGLSDLSP